MTLYTSVDESYSVFVYKSLKRVFRSVDDTHRYLDHDRVQPLTFNAFKKELKENGYALIYETGRSDWVERVDKQNIVGNS